MPYMRFTRRSTQKNTRYFPKGATGVVGTRIIALVDFALQVIHLTDITPKFGVLWH